MLRVMFDLDTHQADSFVVSCLGCGHVRRTRRTPSGCLEGASCLWCGNPGWREIDDAKLAPEWAGAVTDLRLGRATPTTVDAPGRWGCEWNGIPPSLRTVARFDGTTNAG